MATVSPYGSALGRLKAATANFLPKETYATLVGARDLADVTKILEPTPYGPEIVHSAAAYSGATLLEIAINRTFVKRNRDALEAAPFAGRPILQTYLRRWDIQNIGVILAAKAQGRPVTEAEQFLVSSRDMPAGLFAGALTLDDFRILLEQPTVEAVAAALVKFGYGGTLLPKLDEFERTQDVFGLVHALERDYYARLLETARYFQGDEWTVRLFVQSEIDVRNVLLLLKGKDAGVSVEDVAARFIEGGSLAASNVPDLYAPSTVPDVVAGLESRFPSLVEGTAQYTSEHTLTGYEVALNRDRAVRELKRLRSYPLSIGILFGFLLLAELERADLRRIVYGKVYAIPSARLEELLVVPRL
ncbi:MAG TPA: V-type ATPase subunit [Thermoplasmata archaeon]|nr:V-type ATPase subunit [Thermoplasmata archaeon]